LFRVGVLADKHDNTTETSMAGEDVLGKAEDAARRGDLAGAERTLAARWPDQAQMPGDGLHILAMVRFSQKRGQEALKLMQSAVAAEPDALRHRIALGNILADANDHSAAAAAFADALRIDMQWPGLMHAYGLACYRCGNYGEAEQAARALLKQGPNPQAYDVLSCALRAQGKAQDALAAADEAIKLAPENAAVQHSRGAALLKLGRAQEALEVFDLLQARGVQAPAIWLNKGRALAGLKRQSDAIAAYTEGARRWPADKELQKALAEARN
jgi:superkiller protein 3